MASAEDARLIRPGLRTGVADVPEVGFGEVAAPSPAGRAPLTTGHSVGVGVDFQHAAVAVLVVVLAAGLSAPAVPCGATFIGNLCFFQMFIANFQILL